MSSDSILARGRTRGALLVQGVGLEVLVLVVAFVTRLSVVLRGAGLRGTYGYDASVYYAASDALIHGRLPYRDYTLLHPPGIALVLSPFALLGRLTTDHTGFAAATLGWMLLGGVNAALVVRIARTAGFARPAALLGGLFYAVWLSSVYAEVLTRLEPLGNFFLLCGLLAYVRAERSGSRWAALACGLGFGAAACVKIWWAVPLVIIVLWHLVRGRWPRLLAVAGGGILALLLVDGPFFLAAPKQMWSMVVLDQLGRGRSRGTLFRLVSMTGLPNLAPALSVRAQELVVAAVVIVVLAVLALAVRAPTGRLVAVLAAASLVVLLVGPSWFSFYGDFAAPGLALSAAAAASVLLRSRAAVRQRRQERTARSGGRLRPVAIGLGVVLAALATAGAATAAVVLPSKSGTPFPARALAPAVAGARCVMSDAPTLLIQLDVLSRGFDNGCQNWVDVSGRTYGVDAASANGVPLPRIHDMKWQLDLQQYLFSGDAVILYRAGATGIDGHLRNLLAKQPVLGTSGGFTIHKGGPVVDPVPRRASAGQVRPARHGRAVRHGSYSAP